MSHKCAWEDIDHTSHPLAMLNVKQMKVPGCGWHKALHGAGAQKLLSLPSPLEVLPGEKFLKHLQRWQHSVSETSTPTSKVVSSMKRVFTQLGEKKWVLPFYYFNSPIQGGNFRNAFQQMHLSRNHHKVKALLLCNRLNRKIKGRWCWPNFGSKPRCFILHLAEQPHCLSGRREMPN